MASWVDLLAFVLIFSAFVGAIIGVRYIAKQVSSTVSATKESLKDRGLTISDRGVSVRTTSRYSREDYVDATQRGFIKAMGAASFSTADNISQGSDRPSLNATRSSQRVPSRHNSSASVHSNGNGSGSDKGSLGTKEEKEKKRFRLGLKKRNSES